MPTLAVSRRFLYGLLEQEFTQEEFEDLCFQFGVELDDVTTAREMFMREQATKAHGAENPEQKLQQKLAELSNEVLYKIDTPANRYDLLSAEGMAIALRVFLRKMPPPKILLLAPQYTMKVSRTMKNVRDYVVCAILRNIRFTNDSFNSFIDFQEKLHQGLARRRTLASVGTHNLDVCKPPFTYRCVPKDEIKFVPLSQTTEMHCAGLGLETYYQQDRQISKYVPLISHLAAYPVIGDSTGRVLSLPPIINSEYSKITRDTTNVFIECTAPDHHKATVLVNQLVSAFSMYTKEPFAVEGVAVEYEDGTLVMGSPVETEVTPNLSPKIFEVKVDTVCSRVGVNLGTKEVADLLQLMMFETTIVDENTVRVSVPVSRSDVLHPCDLYEDVAIAYGYEKIKMTPCPTKSVGTQTPVNKLSHLLRIELANAGYTEMLTFSLCSREEAFTFLNRVDNKSAVHIANPQTIEFQVARPSLLPGTMKTLHANRSMPLPLKLFEVSDVVVQDPDARTKTRNERRMCAAHCTATGAGFEDIHGLTEYAMLKLGVTPKPLGMSREAFLSANPTVARWYELDDEACHDDAFFPGRRMSVVLYDKDAGEELRRTEIGQFGVLHPLALKNFDFPFPTSYCEINLEPLL